MSPQDTLLCQHAIELAKTDDKQAAYKQFCSLENNNPEDIIVLSWLV